MESKTQKIIHLFEQISAVPRGTGREAALSAWLQSWAAARAYAWKTDPAGNLLIRVPASSGSEAAPVLILQGHMDMVCEKTPESRHDFLADPIRPVLDGEWLRAEGTTLGADNGIAIALAMALAEDGVKHPPLELLFTVEEEVGIGGANRLEPGFAEGKILINLDSEDEGSFIVGCAGGQTTHVRMDLWFEPLPDWQAYHLRVSGLQGGHSGVDIHKHRANANSLLARTLESIRTRVPMRVAGLKGGSAHNAIPREANACIAFDSGDFGVVEQVLREFEHKLSLEYAGAEDGISLTLGKCEAERAVNEVDTEKLVQLLLALPHGVAHMSANVAGFVETSNNFASLEIRGDELFLLTSQRSTVMSRLEELTGRIGAIALLAGAQVRHSDGYPAWQPDMTSPLLERSRNIYQSLFEVAPRVEMIHAGLECGIIGAIFGDMDMISLGATIQNPHSPQERLHIPSVGRVWRFLTALVESYC
ncbi:MAG: aminoacyl-histidine dipeptidase [Chloroflexi bacterium HGW-Chloroflexi-6]|nr:MAG: aminoacyl-histidine dipeptidase [Chloroflexi bacterium HGW-Chloroflexi-6]